MSISEGLKKEIHEYVDKADDRFLRLVHGMIQAEKRSSLNSARNEMVGRAEQSEKDIEEGRTISAHQFHNEYEEWKRKKRQNTQ